MLPDAITTVFSGSEVKVKKVTNVRTIGDSLNQSTMIKSMLGEVNKLLQAYLTFPVTSATAGRSFSSLWKLKTFLRSSMMQQRLNNLFLMCVHTARMEQLNLALVANEFVSSNTRRTNYFGKFLSYSLCYVSYAFSHTKCINNFDCIYISLCLNQPSQHDQCNLQPE